LKKAEMYILKGIEIANKIASTGLKALIQLNEATIKKRWKIKGSS